MSHGVLSKHKRVLRLRKEYLEEKFKDRPDSQFFKEELAALNYVIGKIEDEQKENYIKRRIELGLPHDIT